MSLSHLLVHSYSSCTRVSQCLPDFRWKNLYMGCLAEIRTHDSFKSRPKSNRYVTPSETATLHSKWATPNNRKYELYATWMSYVTPVLIYVSHLMSYGAPLCWGLPYHFWDTPHRTLSYAVIEPWFAPIELRLAPRACEDYSRKTSLVIRK